MHMHMHSVIQTKCMNKYKETRKTQNFSQNLVNFGLQTTES